MKYDEAVTAALAANEPPDNTILFLRSSDEWTVIERDDALSRDYEPGEHWFNVTTEAIGTSDPMTLAAWLKDADTVHSLGKKLAGS